MRLREPRFLALFGANYISVLSVAIVLSAILALTGLAISQTIQYKTPKRPGRGWSDGTQSGGYVKPDPNYQPSRMADGQPDIQGIWQQTVLPGGNQGRNSSIEEIPRGDVTLGDLPTGTMVVDPPDGRIPYKPWARAKREDFYTHYMDTLATCALIGVPRQMNYTDYQIFQVPGEVLIVSEWTNFRHVPLDGRPHIGKDMKLWMGDSRGHWEGNTLVIDTTNQNDETWLSIRGDFHSDKLHVTERLTPIDANTIQYEATLEDPVVYERPWKVAYPLFRNARKNYELLEENCGEGNRSIDSQTAAGYKPFSGFENAK